MLSHGAWVTRKCGLFSACYVSQPVEPLMAGEMASLGSACPGFDYQDLYKDAQNSSVGMGRQVDPGG